MAVCVSITSVPTSDPVERPEGGADGQVEEEFRACSRAAHHAARRPDHHRLLADPALLRPLRRPRPAERVAYYIAFVAALLSSLLLMAPSSHQRLRSGDGVARQHRHHLDVAVRITIIGTVGFVVAVTRARSSWRHWC